MAQTKKLEKQKRLVVLDTHAILHRAYHALPEFSSSKGEPTGGLYGLISMLVKLVNDLKPDYIVAAIDLPGPTYRHVAFEKYKGTRTKADDALVSQLKKAPDLLRAFGVPVYSAEGFEADDIIGTVAEQMRTKKDVDVIIASGDMDTLQLVEGDKVRVFTLKKGLSDTVLYDEEGVKARFGFGPELIPDYKGLRGDPSDNIPGVKGVGEKTATALIMEFGNLENLYKEIKKNPEKVLAAGCKEGMLQKLKEQEEGALFSKMLAEIRRDAPIEFALPKKTWREGVDTVVLFDTFAELDFRSLIPRVKQLFGEGGGSESSSRKVLGSPVQPEDGQPGQTISQETLTPSIPQEEFDELALAVWVVDTNITDPTLDDIYRMGKSQDLAEARATIFAEIKKRDLSFVFDEIEKPLMPVLRRMEKRGVKIDRAFLATLSGEYGAEAEAIVKRIYKAAGGEFNVNSPKQLGDVLFDKLGLATKKKTSSGQRSTREGELVKLRDAHPIIDDILAYRELQKLLGTYIDTIPTLLDHTDRLHTHFRQTGTSTGRLGSENPNVQNIPIKSDLGRRIRNAFVADTGYTLIDFDYSQFELRIAAMLSGDRGLIDIFKKGRDVHAEVAARTFKVREEDVTGEQRRRAKVINFGILYGMGVTSLQQALGTNRKEAQEFYNQYFDAFPRLAAYIDEVKADAARKGYTETLFGRRRYLDGIRSPIPFVRAAAERMAINAPIQGTQADFIKLAMIELDTFLEGGTRGHLLLQVHDELVFEIKKECVDECVPEIKRIMEGVLPLEKTGGVPVVAEGKIGKNWGEVKPLGK